MSRAGRFAVAACVALFAGCRASDDPAVLRAAGHVEATSVRVASKIPGTIAELAVAEGDVVRAGQTLARIDTRDIVLAIAQVRAEKDLAEAELGLRLAGARRQDVAELEAQVAAIDADRKGAERDLERMETLLAKGSGTTKARDDARTRRDALAARLLAMKESLSRMRAGSRAEEIAAARARVRSAEARIAQLEQQVADATLTSPASGIVTEKLAEPGELIGAGAALCVITDLTTAWLTVYVGEPDLGRIRLGQEADVVTDDGQARKGKVTFIASEAEFTPRNVQTREERVKLVFKVKVGLDNHDGLFKPGMPAEARLRTRGA